MYSGCTARFFELWGLCPAISAWPLHDTHRMNRLDADEGRQGPLSSYLSRIDRYSLLTPDQEKQLALRWRRFRDPEAAD